MIYTGHSTGGLIKINTDKNLLVDLIKDKQGYFVTFNIVSNFKFKVIDLCNFL